MYKKRGLEGLPFKVSLPFAPQLFKSSRISLINFVREDVSKVEAGAIGCLSLSEMLYDRV